MKKQTSASKPSQRKAAANAAPDSALDGIVGEGAELHLQLPGFEGPFDLLLHLIEEHELDILNIPVAFVTDRYLQYLALMQELNIDVAADYLVMAATLAHLKSRLLLPTPPADDDADGEDAEQDPRAELIRRLLEYQKYKQAAEQLANRSVLGRDTFVRGALPETVEGPAPLAPIGVFKLLEAFQKILERAKTVLDHHIEFERLSITDRINQLVDRLRESGTLPFDALFDGQRTRAELIVTFLAILEMTRLRLTNVHQEHALAPIVVELAVSDVDQAVAEAIGEGTYDAPGNPVAEAIGEGTSDASGSAVAEAVGGEDISDASGNAVSDATIAEASPEGGLEEPQAAERDPASLDEVEEASAPETDDAAPDKPEPNDENLDAQNEHTSLHESDAFEPEEPSNADDGAGTEEPDGEVTPDQSASVHSDSEKESE